MKSQFLSFAKRLYSAFLPKTASSPQGSVTVTIGPWELDVPADWTAKEGDWPGYLESRDGRLGCYLKSVFRSTAKTTAQAVAEEIQAIHEASFRKAASGTWEVVAREGSEDGEYFRSHLDMLDAENKYRVLSFVFASRTEALQVTVHNYFCDDYVANRDEYRPIEFSIRRAGLVGYPSPA